MKLNSDSHCLLKIQFHCTGNKLLGHSAKYLLFFIQEGKSNRVWNDMIMNILLGELSRHFLKHFCFDLHETNMIFFFSFLFFFIYIKILLHCQRSGETPFNALGRHSREKQKQLSKLILHSCVFTHLFLSLL